MNRLSVLLPLLCAVALAIAGPLLGGYLSDLVVKVMILSIFALSLELLVGETAGDHLGARAEESERDGAADAGHAAGHQDARHPRRPRPPARAGPENRASPTTKPKSYQLPLLFTS